MAGREKKGYEMSVEELFDNCSYVITPLEHNTDESIEIVKHLANDIGAKKILTCTSREHDEYISYVSQLPHVLACAYMASSKERPLSEYAAGSFRDVSRVALINAVIWQELFAINKDFLVDEIDHLISELDKFKKLIEEE